MKTSIKVFTVDPEEKVGYIIEEAEKGWMYPIWRENEVYGYLFWLQHLCHAFLRG